MSSKKVSQELLLEELRHMQSGLNKVIKKSEKHIDSDELKMSDFKECALGTFIEPLNFYTWDVVTEELFGFVMMCAKSGVEYRLQVNQFNKTQALVNSLFVSDDVGDSSVNRITVGEWRNTALKVQKKLNKKIERLQLKVSHKS